MKLGIVEEKGNGEIKETSTGFSLPSGTLVDVNRLPQMDIIHLQSKIDNFAHHIYALEQRLDQLEKIKIKEFSKNDVYEVNKRIERLQGKIALLQSNSNLPTVGVNFILVLISINNLFLGLIWWIYG